MAIRSGEVLDERVVQSKLLRFHVKLFQCGKGTNLYKRPPVSQQNQEATLAALRARLIGLIGNQTMSEIIPGFLDDAKPNMDQLNHLTSQNHST